MNAHLQAVHPVLAARDVGEVLRFYDTLGFAPVFQDDRSHPKYAVIVRDGVELHVQWADEKQWAYPVDRPAFRFIVSDVDAIYREFLKTGAVRAETNDGSPWAAPAATPWGTREFHLRDPSGNSLQFYRPR